MISYFYHSTEKSSKKHFHKYYSFVFNPGQNQLAPESMPTWIEDRSDILNDLYSECSIYFGFVNSAQKISTV